MASFLAYISYIYLISFLYSAIFEENMKPLMAFWQTEDLSLAIVARFVFQYSKHNYECNVNKKKTFGNFSRSIWTPRLVNNNYLF